MTIKEFMDKLKDEGDTPEARLETLRELAEVSELDIQTITQIAKALQDED